MWLYLQYERDKIDLSLHSCIQMHQFPGPKAVLPPRTVKREPNYRIHSHLLDCDGKMSASDSLM